MNERANMTDQKKSAAHEMRNYKTGLVASSILTLVAFGAVYFGEIGRGGTLVVIAITAVIQLIVQFRYFLHIDLQQSHRDDLQLILFTGVMATVMVGGTIWITATQYEMMGTQASGMSSHNHGPANPRPNE